MSKRRKRPKGRHAGGGRVTPKGSRPDPGPNSRVTPQAPTMPEDPVMNVVAGVLEVQEGDDPLPVDLWASQLVGNMAAALRPSSPWQADEDEEWGPEGRPSEEDFFGSFTEALADRLAAPGGAAVATALHALVPYLSGYAADLATEELRSVPNLPRWATLIGTARVERCVLMTHETDDAEQIGLVARYPGTGRTFLAMALIDLNLGGLVKDLMVAEDVELVMSMSAADGIDTRELDPAEARARVEHALRITDMTIDEPVSDDVDEIRPLFERLVATMPEPLELDDHEPPEPAELGALAAHLAAAAAPTIDEHTAVVEFDLEELHEAADLMLGYVAHYVGRPPLTWSPIRVELFLMDYVPRKIAMPPEHLIDLPERLAVLVPAAQQLAGWEDRHVAETLAIIEQVTPEFRSLISSPDAGSPAKQMVMRALAEGIDLEDPAALEEMVERINAMGGIDVFGSGADLAYPLPEPMDTSVVALSMRLRVAQVDAELMELCVDLFDPEHLEMSRALLVRMANEHPDELVRGNPAGWGGGIPYALCQINKVFGNSWRSHLDVQAQDLVEVTGLSQQTLTQRAKQIRGLLDLDHWPPPAAYWRSEVRERYEAFGARIDEVRRRRDD